ncbi:AAA family ATPase [Halomonas denitrificans]|uniref:DNA/RNA helicase domain-containing protein n=1 Tax=Halomonas denitrificans TaxID=370769 RepID=UPI001CD5D616|nr:DNA/RNA helicase domain-containing protein [Halomonas denitrificans]MCA0973111.1 AAA family ATPase [Halomonas denitrificans]
MKSINLLSLSQAHESLDPDEYKSFKEHYKIDIDDAEISDVKTLVSEMLPILSFVNIFNDFYVGYKIQHISKEFDLLRFGSNFILNIEVKNESTEEKIKRQLTRNRYYLHHINEVIHNYCFVATNKDLYQLGESGDIEIVPLESLVQLLTSQNLIKLDSPDTLFNPSDYLVSPFNSTAKFLAGQYFLTGQQEIIKDQITKNITSPSSSVVSLTGGAGTGKTLLTYDIVKSHMETMQTIVVHCGQLNDGHQRLINSGWKVVPIREFEKYDLTDFDLVVVDETQRIYSNQFDNLVVAAASKNTHCIFSYDKQQTLSRSEAQTNIERKIDAISGAYKYSLSDKIRTNKEIANFIKVLFDNKRNNIAVSNCGNIDFDYFTDASNVKNYISLISAEGWEVLRLTPSQYRNEHHESYSQISSQNSHRVIGQEFDNVAVVIDEYFSYGADGKLIYTARTYYDSVKMLFQNITRTRKKLKLIIIGNRQILNRCFSVMR